MENSIQQDPRTFFAAERTFLAWIRTGLGLMGVGFAVARFGLFLREFRSSQSKVPVPSSGLSEWSGVALVALGVLVTLSATFRHFQVVRELSAGRWVSGRVSRDGVALALLLAVFGLAMAGYLIFVR
jgi:putative membrane protein